MPPGVTPLSTPCVGTSLAVPVADPPRCALASSLTKCHPSFFRSPGTTAAPFAMTSSHFAAYWLFNRRTNPCLRSDSRPFSCFQGPGFFLPLVRSLSGGPDARFGRRPPMLRFLKEKVVFKSAPLSLCPRCFSTSHGRSCQGNNLRPTLGAFFPLEFLCTALWAVPPVPG